MILMLAKEPKARPVNFTHFVRCDCPRFSHDAHESRIPLQALTKGLFHIFSIQ